ncbi:MAG: hypothetical protein P1P89_08830 [Desulfobacterales bacterium]|nr:hypothetical protein [Desulfobacterales bacterium]
MKPKLDAIDLKAAKVGSFSAETEFKFKDCCPSKEQEKIALSIQSKIVGLYEKLLNDEISIETYNQKVQAAADAIGKVVLSCALSSKELPLTKTVPVIPPMSLEKAWENLKQVDRNL